MDAKIQLVATCINALGLIITPIVLALIAKRQRDAEIAATERATAAEVLAKERALALEEIKKSTDGTLTELKTHNTQLQAVVSRIAEGSKEGK